jgi:hypothetical protein
MYGCRISVVEQVDGDTTIVQVVDVESDRAHKVPMAMRNDECCCLCKLGVKISFQVRAHECT